MAANRKAVFPRAALGIGSVVVAVTFCWALPLFHVVPLQMPASVTSAAGTAAFDAAAAAAKIWKVDLPAAAPRAVELKSLVGPLRENAETAKAKFAKSAGLGTAYYFIRGEGRVTTREKNDLRVAVDETGATVVAIRIGPVFGNTVRDGCGFLDVNAFPGLREFNALSAELNALVEQAVLPALRDQAKVGTTVQFVGCAEAPDSVADAGEPLLIIVPVKAEVR